MRVLFVCQGNLYRSPVAEGVFRLYYPQHESDSAWTTSYNNGDPANLKSVAICQHNNIDISEHQARAITIEDVHEFDFIYAMDKNTYHKLRQSIPDTFHEKIHTLWKTDIIDPHRGDMPVFEKMYAQIEEAILSLDI